MITCILRMSTYCDTVNLGSEIRKLRSGSGAWVLTCGITGKTGNRKEVAVLAIDLQFQNGKSRTGIPNVYLKSSISELYV